VIFTPAASPTIKGSSTVNCDSTRKKIYGV
jgi:hypothetical protein